MDLGLPLNLMSCKGHGMFKDRIVAMRTANGETIPMPRLGGRNNTSDAAIGPTSSPNHRSAKN